MSTQTGQTEELKTLRAAKEAAGKLTGLEGSLREKHEALLAERKALIRSPKALEEVLANMHALVDKEGARLNDYGTVVVGAFSGHMKLRGDGSGKEMEVAASLPDFEGAPFNFKFLCSIAPDMVKARLEQVIRNSGAHWGLPAADRATKLSALDAAIAEIEAAHTEVVEGVAEVGITLSYLDSVSERHQRKAEREERQRELEQERKAGIYKVVPA